MTVTIDRPAQVDEFACCDIDPDCVHAHQTAATIAALRATAPGLRVAAGTTTVEVYGDARLSLTKAEASDLADNLRHAIGRRQRIDWGMTSFKLGIRLGQTVAWAKRLRGTA